MIEVEKPFIVSDEIKNSLLDKAEFIKSVKNNDIYYDTEDWELIRKNYYLRKRNGRFEMKKPVKGFDNYVGGERTRIYDEIDDEGQIKKLLEINTNKGLGEVISSDWYRVLAEYTVERDKYRIDEFLLEVDSTSFGYEVIDVELIVESADLAKEAEKRLLEFAESHNLRNTPSRGKLPEYCYRKYPEKYHKYFGNN